MSKNKKIIIICIIGLVLVITLGVFIILSSVRYAPQDDQNAPEALVASIIKVNKPLYPHKMELSIPSINVDAKVQEVGITKKGNIGTPNNFTDVAWFKNSPLPGHDGTSVIDGHVDNGLALPAVFWNLKDVKKGDDVYMNTSDNGQVHFMVTDIATYDYNAPTDQILAQSKTPTLKLITCTGVYVAAYKTHDKRLVVTAKKVDSQ